WSSDVCSSDLVERGVQPRVRLHQVLEARRPVVVPSGYGVQREQRAFVLPALGAAAHVVERHVRRDAHRDRIARAPAGECSAGEARRALLYTLINQGVNLDCHGSLSLASGFERDISSSPEELIRTPPCPP